MKQKLTHSIWDKELWYFNYSKTRLHWELGNRYKDTVIRRPEKNPFWGKNTTGNLGRNHGPNSMQLAAHPTRFYSSSKINFKTKKETWFHQRSTVGSEGQDGHHVLYSLLYTTASLPMILAPKAQALSYHVLTKYVFLPNSQAQSLEIPFSFWKRAFRWMTVFLYKTVKSIARDLDVTVYCFFLRLNYFFHAAM